ncbi:MAG: DUF2029 domain-containing protein [Anaerolineales bacterium]|nr:DUF2029 domain-containing protein [Anaerolineales bacterium]
MAHTPEKIPSASLLSILLTLLVIVGIGWNYWLPTAEDYLNMQTQEGYPPNIDFFAYYNAGNRFTDGVNPYYWAETDPTAENYSDFIYPPTILPVFKLLCTFPYAAARYLWAGFYTSLFLLAFLAIRQLVPPENRAFFLLICSILVLTSFPLLLHIRNGQMDIAMISLILLSFALYHKGRILPAAALLAIAAVVKVSPAFLLIYFLLYRRDFRFTACFIAAAAVLVSISLFQVPSDLYLDYLQNVLPFVSRGTSYWLNQSIVKFLPDGHNLSSLVSLAGLGGLSLFYLHQSTVQTRSAVNQPVLRRPDLQDFLLFYLNLLVILAFAGKIWSMAYVWMILPSAFLLNSLVHKAGSIRSLILPTVCILLMNSKVYGYPVLDSLNLFGNLLMEIFIIFLILKHFPRENPA